MARSRIPNALDRRHLIEKDLDAARAREIAEAYLEEGRSVEALHFLARAEAPERLAELRAGAIAAGDVFLLRSVARAMDEAPSADEWTAVGAAAAEAGLEAYAATARRQLERDGS